MKNILRFALATSQKSHGSPLFCGALRHADLTLLARRFVNPNYLAKFFSVFFLISLGSGSTFTHAGFFDDLGEQAERLRKTVEEAAAEIKDTIEKTHSSSQGGDESRPEEDSREISQVHQQSASSGNPNFDSEQVARVQGALNLLGYDAGSIDGKYGANTRNAIRAFQVDQGKHPDGNITSELMASLDKEVGRHQDFEGKYNKERSFKKADKAASNPDSFRKFNESRQVDQNDLGEGVLEGSLSSRNSNHGSKNRSNRVAILTDGRLPVANVNCGLSPGPLVHGCEKGWWESSEVAIFNTILKEYPSSLPESFSENPYIFGVLLEFMPIDVRLDLAQKNIGQLTDNQRKLLSNAGLQYGIPFREFLSSLSPFEARRFWEKVREYTVNNVNPNPSLPIKLRMFCRVEFSSYDFESQSFSLRYKRSACGKPPLSDATLLEALDKYVQVKINPEKLPNELPMDVDEAEKFFNKYKGEQLVLSYDIDVVSLNPKRFEPEILVANSLFRGNVKLRSDLRSKSEIYTFKQSDVSVEAKKPATHSYQNITVPSDAVLINEKRIEDLVGYFDAEFRFPQRAKSYFREPDSNRLRDSIATIYDVTAHHIPRDRGGDDANQVQVFFSRRDGDYVEQISNKIGLPKDHIQEISRFNGVYYYYALPRPKSEYTVTLSKSLDFEGSPAVSIESELVRALEIQLKNDKAVRVLFVLPQNLFILDTDPGRNVPSVPVEVRSLSNEIVDYRTVHYPPAAWYTAEWAKLRGLQAEDVLRQKMEDYTYKWKIGDEFVRSDAINKALVQIEEYNNEFLSRQFWVTGEAVLSDYDPKFGFKFDELKLEVPPTNDEVDSPYKYIKFNVAGEENMAVKLSFDAARKWKEELRSFPRFKVIARVSPSKAEGEIGSWTTIRVSLSELYLIDYNQAISVLDPRYIRYTFEREQ